MKNRLHLSLILALLAFPMISNAQHKSDNKKSACCAQVEKSSFTGESIANENSQLTVAQLEDILNTYFTKETDKEGNTIYSPIMVSMQLDRSVIALDADGNPTIQNQPTQMDIPLITMAPINFVGITGVTTNEFGQQQLQLSELPIPTGLMTIINAYSNSIQPIEISE